MIGDHRTAEFAGLVDAESEHTAAPLSFSIPRSGLRRSLAPKSLVKLLFAFRDGDTAGVERMWVEVLNVVDGRYVGRLDNEPTRIRDLEADQAVDFGPEHVAALWREMPDAPRPEQFAVVSSRIWRRGAPPVRAVRTPPPDERFSGWFLFADDDPATPPSDLSGFEPVNHYQLTDRFRMFDSIEDEPPDSEWRWDDGRLEWVRHQPDG